MRLPVGSVRPGGDKKSKQKENNNQNEVILKATGKIGK